MQVDFSPLLPPGVLLALFVVVVAGAGVGRPGAGARAAVAGAARRRRCLLAGLLNPSLVQEERELFDDVAVVVVDRERQPEGRRPADDSEATLATLQEQLKQCENLEVRVVRAPRTPAAAGRRHAAVRRAAQRAGRRAARRVAGVVLITDGQVHDVPADAGRARLRGAGARRC